MRSSLVRTLFALAMTGLTTSVLVHLGTYGGIADGSASLMASLLFGLMVLVAVPLLFRLLARWRTEGAQALSWSRWFAAFPIPVRLALLAIAGYDLVLFFMAPPAAHAMTVRVLRDFTAQQVLIFALLALAYRPATTKCSRPEAAGQD